MCLGGNFFFDVRVGRRLKKRKEAVITLGLPLLRTHKRSVHICWPLTWVNSPIDPALHPNRHPNNEKGRAILHALMLNNVNSLR